jgi:hypothetical protein
MEEEERGRRRSEVAEARTKLSTTGRLIGTRRDQDQVSASISEMSGSERDSDSNPRKETPKPKEKDDPVEFTEFGTR